MGRLFGTDGIRGKANTYLTCEMALRIGRATAQVLEDDRRRLLFCVGCDTRISSDMLCHSIAAGLCSAGADVIILGVVPTPALAYLVNKYKADSGIMISASHNPAEYNGIKIFGGEGYKIPDELEEKIESIVLDESDSILSETEIGKIKYATKAVRDYVDHLKSTVMNSLDGMKVAVDCSNGSSFVSAKTLFTELGADVTILNASPNGWNINKNCGSTHIEPLRQYVVDNGMDAGIAFDGDADRCICVDSKGNVIDGDFIMAICAQDMKERGKLYKNSVVGTIMTNMGFEKFARENSITTQTTKVGDRFVLEKMLLEGINLGGEQSGHIIFNDYATTGDGQLTAIQLLSILKRKKISLEQAASVMTRFPQHMINVEVSNDGKIAFYTDHVIKEALMAANEEFADKGRIVVRPSGTEPLVRVMTEGEDPQQTKDICEKVANIIKQQLSVK
ncbi:MAG: phosphoglucosamine mutase [Clostridia bacterium]|nr:phosphoglucosamine mutase [Clostridia bacterium]